MKTSKMYLDSIKDSDGWMELAYELFKEQVDRDYVEEDEAHRNLHDKANKIFQYGEYANIEIEVDEKLNIVGGRIIPHKEDWNR